jgi:hypothetical protein
MRPMMNLSHLVSFERRYFCRVLTVFVDGEDALRSVVGRVHAKVM